MAKASYVRLGNSVEYLNQSEKDIEYQEIVVMSGCIGVAACTILPGEVGTVNITEAFAFPAAKAIPVGAPVYWNEVEEVVTVTAEGNTPAGICLTGKVDAAPGTVEVRLCPSVTAAGDKG